MLQQIIISNEKHVTQRREKEVKLTCELQIFSTNLFMKRELPLLEIYEASKIYGHKVLVTIVI